MNKSVFIIRSFDQDPQGEPRIVENVAYLTLAAAIKAVKVLITLDVENAERSSPGFSFSCDYSIKQLDVHED